MSESNNNYEASNNEAPEGMIYDVFSENSTNVRAETANREYLNLIYKDGIELDGAEILMTRSQYIEQLSAIEKKFQVEKRGSAKIILFTVFAVAFGVIGTVYFRSVAQNIAGLIGTMLCSFAINLWSSIFAVLVFFLVVSLIKRNRKIKKARQTAIDRLEQRKHELMILGQYDASR